MNTITRVLHSIFNHRKDISSVINTHFRYTDILMQNKSLRMSFQYSKAPWPRGSVRGYDYEGAGFESW